MVRLCKICENFYACIIIIILFCYKIYHYSGTMFSFIQVLVKWLFYHRWSKQASYEDDLEKVKCCSRCTQPKFIMRTPKYEVLRFVSMQNLSNSNIPYFLSPFEQIADVPRSDLLKPLESAPHTSFHGNI